MSIANKYNNNFLGFNFEIPKEYQYKTLKDLFETKGEKYIYLVKALYINTKSQYGESPVIATDKELVNAPSHLVDTVKSMRQDEEFVNAVNDGKVGFTIYKYDTKTRKNCYSVKWCDIEVDETNPF